MNDNTNNTSTNVTPKEDIQVEYAIMDTDITQKELDELKVKYKKIFRSYFIDKTYVWHRLNRKDFNQICADTESIKDEDELIAAREKEFCKACVIYPRQEEMLNIIEEDDIVASKISQEILYRSGFYAPVTNEV